MKKVPFKNFFWFFAGLLSALSFGAYANLPSASVDGSMVPETDVSEIRAKRQAELSFDRDLQQLSRLQARYRENLPLKKSQGDRVRTRQSSRR